MKSVVNIINISKSAPKTCFIHDLCNYYTVFFLVFHENRVFEVESDIEKDTEKPAGIKYNQRVLEVNSTII